jgi:hypothetical protein
LPLIPSVSPDDVLPIVDSGFTTTYKVKVSQLAGTSGTSGVSGSSGTSGTSGLGFTWQGGWQSITTYYKNDVVYYSGASYVALGTITAGGNPPDVNASWENMNAQGASGSSGTSGVSGSSGTSGVSGSSGTSGTSGTSGASNSVYSGGTLVVSGATILNFSGATITSGGTGEANITITAEGGLVNGTGTSSLKQKDGLTTTPATASGTNSIAIGNNANASGADSVCIGDIAGNSTALRSISIGKHGQVVGDQLVVIGSGSYTAGNGGIAIGHETAAYNGGIVLGGNTSRATSIGAITLGNANERNLGSGYSSILGYGNKIGDAPNYNPGPYNNIIGSFSVINGDDASYGYNNIFGGSGNYITGTTSGATIIGSSNITSIGKNDVVIGYGNTTYQAGYYNSVIGGQNNSITGGNNSAIVGGGSNSSTGVFGGIFGGSGNAQNGNAGVVLGGYNNTSNSFCGIMGGYINTNNAEIGFIHGNQSRIEGQTNGLIGAEQSKIFSSGYNTKHSFIGGGYFNVMTDSPRTTMLGGQNNTITNSADSSIIGGTGNTISGRTNVVMIGTSGRTATTNTATFVENLVVFNYAGLDYANDAAAEAGGVVLGQVYHHNGQLKIRIV